MDFCLEHSVERTAVLLQDRLKRFEAITLEVRLVGGIIVTPAPAVSLTQLALLRMEVRPATCANATYFSVTSEMLKFSHLFASVVHASRSLA
jgi:hypothetical protein